jgi:hypothetical protein
MFNTQISFNHDHDQSRQKFRRTTPQIRSFNPRYANLFYGYCFYCTNFGHKVEYFKDYKRNFQARNAYVAPRNIEFYKCHNYGHITSDCRSMVDTSMKENIDIGYKKVWIRKHNQYSNEECTLTLQAKQKKCGWYVENGCSKHMTGDKDRFIPLRKERLDQSHLKMMI